jgi:hypothetical protein
MRAMQAVVILMLWISAPCADTSVQSSKDENKPVTVTFWDRIRTDYGKPTAQFEAARVATLAGKYLNKKVTIKGEVTKVDVSNPKHCLVHMHPSITFDFVEMKTAAECCQVGETAIIDGILKRHSPKGQILLAPAFTRDPSAPFTPIKP